MKPQDLAGALDKLVFYMDGEYDDRDPEACSVQELTILLQAQAVCKTWKASKRTGSLSVD